MPAHIGAGRPPVGRSAVANADNNQNTTTMLHAIHNGRTGPDVLLVHGNSLSSASWTTLLDDDRTAHYHMVAVDLPGHGSSPRDMASYSTEGLARALAAFAGTLKEPVLVGHSLGGHVCMRALRHIPTARGLVLMGTPPMATTADMQRGFLPHPDLAKTGQADLSQEEAEALARCYTWDDHPALPSIAATIMDTDPRIRRDIAAELASGVWHDEPAMLHAFGRPVHVIHGADDPLVSATYLGELAPTYFHGGRVRMIAGAGHSPQLQQPAAFAQELTDLLSTID